MPDRNGRASAFFHETAIHVDVNLAAPGTPYRWSQYRNASSVESTTRTPHSACRGVGTGNASSGGSTSPITYLVSMESVPQRGSGGSVLSIRLSRVDGVSTATR